MKNKFSIILISMISVIIILIVIIILLSIRLKNNSFYNSDAESQNVDYKFKISELKVQNDELTKQNSDLAQKNDELTKQNSDLTQKSDEFLDSISKKDKIITVLNSYLLTKPTNLFKDDFKKYNLDEASMNEVGYIHLYDDEPESEVFWALSLNLLDNTVKYYSYDGFMSGSFVINNEKIICNFNKMYGENGLSGIENSKEIEINVQQEFIIKNNNTIIGAIYKKKSDDDFNDVRTDFIWSTENYSYNIWIQGN